MSVNVQLVEEILTKSGNSEAVQYLMLHEQMSLEEASNFVTIMTESKLQYKEQFKKVFEHYCMHDKEIWVGPDGSLCPTCGTDGDVNDNVESKQVDSSFWNTMKEKMAEIKEEIMG